ncbi:MAG: tRNA guanosine(34) transglycosylase Tgt [Chloroflexi bacterium]|nr:tRNA guanosine(34) transglycosylase Tgt [Chloroflexota bacterium]
MIGNFFVEAEDGNARAGVLNTAHGSINTPAFMPVATQGSVKALDFTDLRSMGAHVVLSNTYHLMLRPGIDLIRDLGGLHKFIDWDGPILTDSGGFQTFSLGKLTKVTDAGVQFRSHIDGSLRFLSPEIVLEYQSSLGVDIAMVLDQCSEYGLGHAEIMEAMRRTHDWALRSRETHNNPDQLIFGIVQGGWDIALRKQSAEFLKSLDFDGYAIGGMSVGEPKSVMYETVSLMGQELPYSKPRYLMGVGSPEDLVESVYMGVDLFDCVLPTRVARNGSLMTLKGRINILNKQYSKSTGPIEESCDCYTCERFSVAYLHHLFKARELSAYRLASIHNLRFILKLMEDMRLAIKSNTLGLYREEFARNYHPTDESIRLVQKQKWSKRRQESS